jgi:hypothetical protein
LLALAYAVSHSGTTADAESAAEGDKTPVTAEQPDTASAVLPGSTENSSKTADIVTEPKAKASKPTASAKPAIAVDTENGEAAKIEEVIEPAPRRADAAAVKEPTPVRNIPSQQAKRTPRAAEQRVPVSRIEDVFSGVSAQEERQLRRQQRLEDQAAEDEAIRRERRRLRRQMRPNGWPF